MAYPEPAMTGAWLCSAISHAFDWPSPPGFRLLLQKAITAARSVSPARTYTPLASILHNAARQYCAHLPTESARALIEAFDTLPRPRVDPDAAQAINDLRGSYCLLLTTSSDVPRQVLETWLEEAGILDAFASLVLPAEAGCAMPNPAFYHHLVRLAAQQPAEILFLGARTRTGENGPRSVGMPALRITPVWAAKVDPDEPPQLRDLPSLLDTGAPRRHTG